jgi:hypothetical protein
MEATYPPFLVKSSMRPYHPILWLILTISLFSRGFSQVSAPKYSNEFLKIGVGARAAAMGNSVTGIVKDVTAGYWNPAGLLSAPETPEFALMHSEYFAGIAKYDYAAFTMPVQDDARIGVSLIRLGVDDIANTLNLIDGNGNINYDNITKFSVSDFAAIFSYARPLPFLKNVRFGANAKIIYRNVGTFANAWGFGLDAGFQYDYKRLKMGLVVRDITSTFNAWSFNTTTFQDAFLATGNVIPVNSLEITLPSMRGGAGYLFWPEKKFNLLASVDLNIGFDGKRNVLANLGPVSIDPTMGLEVGFKKLAFLRGGFSNLQKTVQDDLKSVWTVFPTVGAGFAIKSFQIDYALTNVGNFSQVLYSHLFSLKFTWDKSLFSK